MLFVSIKFSSIIIFNSFIFRSVNEPAILINVLSIFVIHPDSDGIGGCNDSSSRF